MSVCLSAFRAGLAYVAAVAGSAGWAMNVPGLCVSSAELTIGS